MILQGVHAFDTASIPNSLLRVCTLAPGNPILMGTSLVIALTQSSSPNTWTSNVKTVCCTSTPPLTIPSSTFGLFLVHIRTVPAEGPVAHPCCCARAKSCGNCAGDGAALLLGGRPWAYAGSSSLWACSPWIFARASRWYSRSAWVNFSSTAWRVSRGRDARIYGSILSNPCTNLYYGTIWR